MYLTVYENGVFSNLNQEERKLKGFRAQEEGEKFEEYLCDLGFDSCAFICIGSEYSRKLEIYQSQQDCYFAYAEFSNVISEILILGIGSLLMFLKSYESIFQIKPCEYFETASNNWIRKDSIMELRLCGDYKKDELVELIGYDSNENPTILMKNSREYISTRLKEDFNIDY